MGKGFRKPLPHPEITGGRKEFPHQTDDNDLLGVCEAQLTGVIAK